MTFRSNDPLDDFARHDREEADEEKFFPHCSLCGAVITGDYYHHVYIRGLDYILCDDCLEEESVDSYYNAQKYGY